MVGCSSKTSPGQIEAIKLCKKQSDACVLLSLSPLMLTMPHDHTVYPEEKVVTGADGRDCCNLTGDSGQSP